MEDLKEELLDTVAIIQDKLKDLGLRGKFLILLTFCLWPLFYFLMTLSVIKFIISGVATLYISILSYKSNKISTKKIEITSN